MKNNRIIKVSMLVLLGFSLALSSCKKEFLDLKPYTALPVADALKTEADLQVALRGAYAGLRGVDIFGRTIPVLGDIMADNVYQSAQNSNRYTNYNQYLQNVTDGNAQGMWQQSYNVILRCNNIINSPVAANANVNQYKGEAYSIRALLYFYLVRFYAKPFTEDPTAFGVPIVTTFDQNLKPGRSKVSEVYTLILNDLTQAYTLMTLYVNTSQFSKYAAKGLEAKVYLTMGDMPKALTAANDVITNGGFSAVTTANFASYWGNPTIGNVKLETLFEVSSDAVGNLAFDALGYIYNQAGYGDMIAADDLANLYSATDVRKTALLQLGSRASLPAWFVRKYINIATDRDDTKILRLSDIYLIAAEASTGSNETNARTFLNFVATRRDASFAGYTSTGAALVSDIITERRKELAFEGDRFHDLNRLKQQINRSTNFPVAARNIPYPFDKRLLPIPQVETDANPTIKAQQNPGYQ
jgi:starch-binding outer membrane protein, SusD/RagB family